MCRIMYEGRVSTNCSHVRSDFEKRDCRELVQFFTTKLFIFTDTSENEIVVRCEKCSGHEEYLCIGFHGKKVHVTIILLKMWKGSFISAKGVRTIISYFELHVCTPPMPKRCQVS